MKTVRSLYDAKQNDGLQYDPEQERLVQRLDVLGTQLRMSAGSIASLKKQTCAPHGVYIWGDVGRGKSMLVAMLVEAYEDVAIKRAHFHTLMREIHRALHHARNSGQADPIHAAADQITDDLALLVLDELEITDVADAMIIGRVLERMITRGVSIVATSNSRPTQLYEHGIKRDVFLPFVRLIDDNLDVIHLDNKTDYRRCSASRPLFYLTPAQDDVTDRMDALWQSLAMGTEERCALSNDLELKRKGPMVRGSFDALCRSLHATSDYIDLAQSVNTVIVEDVPRMAASDQDAARRFMLLIDTLYDARCGLVISSVSRPEHLCVDGELAQKFLRTVSRLYEMCRADWPGNSLLVHTLT